LKNKPRFNNQDMLNKIGILNKLSMEGLQNQVASPKFKKKIGILKGIGGLPKLNNSQKPQNWNIHEREGTN
jgi:hypothetical protein